MKTELPPSGLYLLEKVKEIYDFLKAFSEPWLTVGDTCMWLHVLVRSHIVLHWDSSWVGGCRYFDRADHPLCYSQDHTDTQPQWSVCSPRSEKTHYNPCARTDHHDHLERSKKVDHCLCIDAISHGRLIGNADICNLLTWQGVNFTIHSLWGRITELI